MQPLTLATGADPRSPEFVLVTYWEGAQLMETIPLLNEPSAPGSLRLASGRASRP